MGLFIIRARFADHPPTEEGFRRELLAAVGSLDGLDGFHVEGTRVDVSTMLDPVTRPYAISVLQRLGGTYLDARTLEPTDPKLPAFVTRRWLEWPWWKRLGIRLLFLLGLAANALPTPRLY